MSEVLTNGIKVPDKGSRSWYDDMRGDLGKLDALIGSASSVTVNPVLMSGIKIASITVNGTSYSLYQQDGDTNVQIDTNTSNNEYPIALSTSNQSNTGTLVMSASATINPSTNAITASSFVGNSGSFSNKVEAPFVRATADLGLVLANKDSTAPTTTRGWNQVQFYDKNFVQLGYFQLASNTDSNVYNLIGRKNANLTDWRNIFWNVDAEVFGCDPSNTVSLGSSIHKWANVYATTVNTSILDIPQNAIVLAFCSSAVNNGSTVAGTVLKVANGGTSGAFTATTETLTGTYRALYKIDS